MKDFNTRKTEETTNTWLTPPAIVKALSHFDLDPCTPPVMPWQLTPHRYTEADDGLKQPWAGIWCNNCGWVYEDMYKVQSNGRILQEQPPQERGGQYLQGMSQKNYTDLSCKNKLSSQRSCPDKNKMQKMQPMEARGFKTFSPETSKEERAMFMVPGLLEGACKNNNADAESRPFRIRESEGIETKTYAERAGEGLETKSIHDGQPQEAAAKTCRSMGMEFSPMESMQDNLGTEMCLLSEKRGNPNSRPLYSTKQSGLSRNSFVEHGSCLQKLQQQQKPSAPIYLDEGQRKVCPDCGNTCFIKKKRCFVNPPYGSETFKWLAKLAEHKRGIALIFARTDTKGFQQEVFGKAHSVFFREGRIRFHKEDGSLAGTPGAPSCFVSYSEGDTVALAASGMKGKLVFLSPSSDLRLL